MGVTSEKGLCLSYALSFLRAQAYPRTPRAQTLGAGWTWCLVVGGEGPGGFEKILRDLSLQRPVLVRVEASYVESCRNTHVTRS